MESIKVVISKGIYFLQVIKKPLRGGSVLEGGLDKANFSFHNNTDDSAVAIDCDHRPCRV